MGIFDVYPGGHGRRTGCGSRMMGAFLIVMIALFMYWTNVEENPVTGERQHVTISPSQEVQLGLQAAPQMAAEMGGELPNSDPRTQLVQRIGNQLVKSTKADQSPWKFQFHLLADPETVNAFALPGGQIFLTLGLFNKLKNEAQLAGVLGHEMGHVIHRHAAEHMATGQLGQMLILATQVGASDPNNPHSGYGAAMVANVVNQMTQLHYGRQDELEADQWGLLFMSQAGYTPWAMVDVMNILKEASQSSGTPEMLLSHPYPENRVEQIQAYLKAHPPSSNLKEGRNLRDLIR